MNKLLTTFFGLILSFSLQSQVSFVKQGATGNGTSWADASGDLKAILDNATNGDEIWVASGTYTPTSCTNCEVADRGIPFEIQDGVQVYGGFSGTETNLADRDWENNPTILSGDIDNNDSLSNNSYSIIYTSEVSANTIVDGFILQGGNADIDSSGVPGHWKRGGAWFNQGVNGRISNPTIRNCTFTNNSTMSLGGAMYNEAYNGTCNPTYENCTFSHNYSDNAGAAIYNSGNGGGNSSPTLIDCYFYNNYAEKIGPALLNDGTNGGNSSPYVINCRFTENEAGYAGGAAYNFGKSGKSEPYYINCIFDNNFGAFGGGAMYNLGSAQGWAVPHITNCTFYGNYSNVGGAIYSNNSDSTGVVSPQITNCVFWDNYAISGFAPVMRNLFGSPVISHSIFDVTDCSILNSGNGANVTCGAGIVFNEYPMFVDTAQGNYRLQAESPAIDIGNNEAIDTMGITTDADGLVRISNGNVDIGAYEFVASTYTPPSISANPNSQELCEGEAVQFEVAAQGTGPLTYQWQKNEVDIPNANTNVFAINEVTIDDIGQYRCLITSPMDDQVATDVASLIINEKLPVSVDISTTSLDICEGELVVFNSAVSNAGTNPTYAWMVNDIDIGNSSDTYTNNNFSNGDKVSCVLTSSETCVIEETITSNIATLNVQELLAVDIAITSNATSICEGTMVEFTSQVDNEGTNPSYQWQLNGADVGADQSSLNLNSLSDNDQVTCILTSSENCVLTSTATANSITIDVSTNLEPSLMIEASGLTICEGETLSFTAIATHGGANPSYQWQLNGENVGSNNTELSLNSLSNNDELNCILTSSENCVLNETAQSNTLAINVSEILQPALTIEASDIVTCEGETVSFNAVPTHGGTNPSYQWQLNNEPIGSDAASLELANLADGDEITCILSSSETCITNSTVLAEAITMTINETVDAQVIIETIDTNICSGELVDFTAIPTNGGINPNYQWQLNGINIGTNSASFSTNTLSNGDVISCLLTSSSNCVQNAIVNAEPITVNVTQTLPAIIQVQASAISICEGETVNFSATGSNGGDSPSYQWFLNGDPVGDNSALFSIDSLHHNDQLNCSFTSSADCILEPVQLSDTFTIEVNSLVDVNVDIAASSTDICQGESVQFEAIANNEGANPVYQWLLNGVAVGNNSPNITLIDLEDNQEVSCILTSSVSCAATAIDTSNLVAVSVTPVQDIDISIEADTDTICIGREVAFTAIPINGGDSPEFTWFVNGQIVGDNGAVYTANNINNGDEIVCELIASGNCILSFIDTSNVIVADVQDCTVNTEDYTFDTNIKIFPNPTDGLLNIDIQGLQDEVLIHITDVQGRLIKKDIIEDVKNDLNLFYDMNSYLPGVYFIKITNNSFYHSKKIILK